MFPNPLGQGGPSRRGPIGPSPLSQVTTASRPKGKAADRGAPAQPEPVHGPYQQPAQARSRAGMQTPESVSYEHLPSLHASVDNLIPGKPGSSSHTPAALESAGTQDTAPARKPRRHQRPLDPSIAAITLKDTPRTRELERSSSLLESQPHPLSGSRNASTDDFGLPLPATSHRAIRDQVLAEDEAIRSRTKKIGAAITGAIGTVVLGGAAALTYQEGKGKF